MLTNSFRLFGGWSCIISGLFLFIAHFINFLGGEEEGTLTGSSFVLAAHVLLVFALFGIYLAQEAKVLGFLGMVLSVFGTIFVSGIVFVEIAGLSGLNTDLVFKAPVAAVIYSIGPLLFALGMLLLGISIILAKKLPKSGGYFLIIGTLVFALASLIESEKLLIEAIGAAFTGLGFIFLGWPMVQRYPVEKTTKLDV